MRTSGVSFVFLCLNIKNGNVRMWLIEMALHAQSCSTKPPCLSVLHFVCHFTGFISHTNLHHTQQPSAPRESYSRSCSQSELTPRPFSNCPGMFSGAQSNWTVTITNGWFAAARHCNVALNERKHAHQFHTVANTILLWVIVVGHFSFKVLPRLGKSFLIVCTCVSISWRGDN